MAVSIEAIDLKSVNLGFLGELIAVRAGIPGISQEQKLDVYRRVPSGEEDDELLNFATEIAARLEILPQQSP